MKLLTQENVVVAGAVAAGLLFFGAAFTKCSPSSLNNNSGSDAGFGSGDKVSGALLANQAKSEKEAKALKAKLSSATTDYDTLEAKYAKLEGEYKSSDK